MRLFWIHTMRDAKPNRILLMVHGLILTTVLTTATSAEAELMEAAFQGHCGHTSPCEQLCYEIHDGMYECDCIEGYELNKNGYSCQVIYSTPIGDGHSKSDEDVLYQKGTSFSASLAKNNSYHDNEQTKSISNDYYISSEIISFDGELALSTSADQENEFDSSGIYQQIEQRNPATTSRTAPKRSSNQSKNDLQQRTPYYNDVNNNQLKLGPPKHNTYHNQNPRYSDTHSTKSIFYENRRRYAVASTTTSDNKLNISNISKALDSTESPIEFCSLDCGLDGICDSTNIISRCLCPFGKSGTSCMEETKISIPKFSKKSWIAFPALRGAYKHVQIRVEFRPESFNGIILLSGERDDLTGDFMALLLNKGFIEFWFDCGSGVGSVRSSETILLNEWNSVIIYRHKWNAWLVLNHGIKVQGRSNGLFSRITFREPVFLGGTGNITGLARHLPVFYGFAGCIRRFVANEHEYKFEKHPLGDVAEGFDIQDCLIDKCFKHPCQHGGKCLKSYEGGVCLCPIGFVGDLCEVRVDLQVPAFNGSSFLRYGPLGDSSLIWLELKIILKPERPDGLILYSGREKHADFIAVILNNAFVEFFFDLGSGPAIVRSEHPLIVGQWHTIKISRTARLAVLKIDNTPEVMTISSNGFWHLSLPESLFLGGVNHLARLPVDLKSKSFFVGCIQKVDINGHSLAIVSEALSGTNIGNCPHACVARPCGPLAECLPQMESYECRCGALNLKCNKSADGSRQELKPNKPKNRSNISEGRIPIEHEWKINKLSFQPFKSELQLTPPISATEPFPKHSINQKKASIISADFEGKTNTELNAEDVRRCAQLVNDRIQRNPKIEEKKKSISVPLHFKKAQHPHRTHLHPYFVGKKAIQRMYDTNTKEKRKLTSMQTQSIPKIGSNIELHDIDIVYIKDDNFNSNQYKYEKVDDEQQDDRQLAYKINCGIKLVNENTNAVQHYRKHLPRKLKTIRDKSTSKASTTNTKTQRKVLTDFNNYGKEIIRNKNAASSTGNLTVNEELFEVNKWQQAHNDWSLLTKFELSADHQSQVAEVHKNFGACFVGQDSYFHYNDAETMSQIISYTIDLNLRIKTHSKNGVLVWTGRQSPTNEDDDFLSLGIENSYLHFRFDLGSGEVDILFNKTKVSDGLWHRVRAIRDSQSGYLEVDGRKSKALRSPGKLRQLNTDTGLYVGGMPQSSYFVRRKYSNGIIGCISEVVLAGELKLNFDPNTLGTAHNVETGIL